MDLENLHFLDLHCEENEQDDTITNIKLPKSESSNSDTNASNPTTHVTDTQPRSSCSSVEICLSRAQSLNRSISSTDPNVAYQISKDALYTSLSRDNGAHGRMSRWMRTLKSKSRSLQHPSDLTEIEENPTNPADLDQAYSRSYNTTVYTDSTGFVNRMRTATASAASLSHYTNGDTASRGIKRDIHSSCSKESHSSWDMATLRRARERFNIIEEIVISEETYLADLRTLSTVYSRTVADLAPEIAKSKESILVNITDILEIHELFLSSILNSFPASTISHFYSYDTGKNSNPDIYQLTKGDGLAEPETIMNLCEIFEEMQQHFFVYEEYAANYKEMISSVDGSTCDGWRPWESGYEMIANTVDSYRRKASFPGKKAASLSDLLIKPIQRICKYPQIFERLLKHSPVIDCPESNAQLLKILSKCKATADLVNSIGSNDKYLRDHLKKTWLVRQRLVLERESHCLDGIWPDRERDVFRYLGRLNLCGALFIVWPGKEAIEGRYMACLLYKTHLVLANILDLSKDIGTPLLSIEFLIPLESVELEASDVEEGLSCPYNLLSWKVKFEAQERAYEIIACAGSQQEEAIWRKKLSKARDAMHSESITDTKLKTGQSVHATRQFNTLHVPVYLSVVPKGMKYSKDGPWGGKSSPTKRQRLYKSRTTSSVLCKCKIYVDFKDNYSDMSIDFTNAAPPAFHMIFVDRFERYRIEELMTDIWSVDQLKRSNTSRFIHFKRSNRQSSLSNRPSTSERSFSDTSNSIIRKLSINGLMRSWGGKKKARVSSPSVSVDSQCESKSPRNEGLENLCIRSSSSILDLRPKRHGLDSKRSLSVSYASLDLKNEQSKCASKGGVLSRSRSRVLRLASDSNRSDCLRTKSSEELQNFSDIKEFNPSAKAIQSSSLRSQIGSRRIRRIFRGE